LSKICFNFLHFVLCFASGVASGVRHPWAQALGMLQQSTVNASRNLNETRPKMGSFLEKKDVKIAATLASSAGWYIAPDPDLFLLHYYNFVKRAIALAR